MQITLSSEYGWSDTITVKSLTAAKQAGTRALAHGCGCMTLETPEGTYQRSFRESGNRFWWDKWEQVA